MTIPCLETWRNTSTTLKIVITLAAMTLSLGACSSSADSVAAPTADAATPTTAAPSVETSTAAGDEVQTTTASTVAPTTDTVAAPPAASCDGDYTGSYAGGDNGSVTLNLTNETVVVSFASEIALASIDGLGTIDADGQIQAELVTGAAAAGSLDETTCTMSGTWTNAGLTGTWEAAQTVAPEAESAAAPCTGGPDFRAQELVFEDLTGDLQCADFSQSNNAQGTFVDANLDGSSFANATLAQVEATDSTFRGADFRGASFAQSTFTNVDFTGALTAGVTVGQSTFTNTICPDGTNSDANGGTCNF